MLIFTQTRIDTGRANKIPITLTHTLGYIKMLILGPKLEKILAPTLCAVQLCVAHFYVGNFVTKIGNDPANIARPR